MRISLNSHDIHIATDGIMVHGFISPMVKFHSPSSPLPLPAALWGIFERGVQVTLLLNLMQDLLKQRRQGSVFFFFVMKKMSSSKDDLKCF